MYPAQKVKEGIIQHPILEKVILEKEYDKCPTTRSSGYIRKKYVNKEKKKVLHTKIYHEFVTITPK